MNAPVAEAEPPRRSSSLSTFSPPAPPLHRCDLCDKDTVQQIAQVLLLSLATACVDSTTGDFFRTPYSIAVDTRRDLIDYLTVRCSSYASDSSLLLLDGDPDVDPSHPSEIISDLAEEFAASRRGVLGRVSSWILSETREDKIDDLVQELESNGFWLPDRLVIAAEPLLRGVDLRVEHHCAEAFADEESLAEHRLRRCPFRLLRCENVGCEESFSAARAGRHEVECEYKLMGCEQGCGETILRREMDRHCITICPMKLVNCPFYNIGCGSTIPRCRIPQHCKDYLLFHLLYALQNMRKLDVPTAELRELASMLDKSQSDNELSEILNARSLTLALKRQEGKIKRLEAEINERHSREKEPSQRGEIPLEENKIEDYQVDGHAQDNKVEGRCNERLHSEEQMPETDGK